MNTLIENKNQCSIAFLTASHKSINFLFFQNVEATFLGNSTESFTVPITLKSTLRVQKAVIYSAIGSYMYRRVIRLYYTSKHWKLKENQTVSTMYSYGSTGCGVFQTGDTKLERFLPKNKHTQKQLLNFDKEF